MPARLQIKEIQAERVLNPTSIDLGEYVINPFKGCELGCIYCYVKTNRATANYSEPWGTYVDIRVNSPDQLIKELETKKVETVLLGSTTELFQPIEKKYRVTEKILTILNERKIYYVILTRSPAILEVLPLISSGLCKKIYFTVNDFSNEFKRILEPKAADFKSRAKAIDILLDHNLNVVTYFCPVLPWISNHEKAFEIFQKPKSIQFEFLNFTLKNIDEVLSAIESVDSQTGKMYRKMRKDPIFYREVWLNERKNIERASQKSGKKFHIFEHSFEGFFENRYHDVKI